MAYQRERAFQRKSRFLILFIALLLIIGGGAVYYGWTGLQPVEIEKGKEKIVVIPPNSSTRAVGKILEENKLIRSAGMFGLYAKLKGIGSQIKAGKYKLTVGETTDAIILTLTKGEIYKDTYQVTIPEGYTVEQIADRLANKGLVNKNRFLQEVDKGTFTEDIVKGIPADPRIKHRLEGYLFPDTYEFEKGMTEHQIIDEMLQQTEKVWKTEWDVKFKQHHLSIHQALTLASIVEREVRVDKERPEVAEVFYNRLAKGMPLQADATLQYVFKKQKQRVTFSDLKLDSPYNTYKIKGLPPGPIANPGEPSIDAVANPQMSHFLYYVAKQDGTGEHYFAVTFSDHLKNITKSRHNQK
ncbi:endolytic transglycosylase MltG [Aneurinibacillus terranovensis]|uniref:endolytic transglycosylase MltG n=1 Tax=Aneurinibacillus terranovensis TaxID=278991 RepID=UPI000404DEFD|nr:endolytic transglycosylase MltG [Aneurinibacillus terranovensis]